MASRLSQQVIEVASSNTSSSRLSQQLIEVASSNTSSARLGQQLIEAAYSVGTSSHTRLSQQLIEVAWQNFFAPAGVAASGACGGELTVVWDAVAGALHYNVYRSAVTGGPYSLVGSTVALFYDDNPPAQFTTYYYVITAAWSVNESAYSTEVSAQSKSYPGAVVLTAVPGDEQVSLSWTASANAQTYTVVRGTTFTDPETPYVSVPGVLLPPGAPVLVVDETWSGLTVQSLVDTNVQNNVQYTYIVYGVNPCGEGAASVGVNGSYNVNATPICCADDWNLTPAASGSFSANALPTGSYSREGCP